MPYPAIVLRPEPGLGATLSGLRDRGIEALAAPLFTIGPVAWDVPEAAEFDALLVGSANVFRHGGAGLAQLADLPVCAVGARTAQAARDAGFVVAQTGQGGLQSLIDTAGARLRFLRLAGEKRVGLAPPEGVIVTERIVYRAAPLPLSDTAAERLRRGAVAVLHSGEAARHFAAECDRIGIDRGTVAIAALAPRIAEAAGSGWREADFAMQMTELALLALSVQMCQRSPTKIPPQ